MMIISFKNISLLILLTISSIGINSQALVTLNPFQYYNKLPGDYLYFELLHSPEKLSADQLAYAQIYTLKDYYNHAFKKEKFYNFKNILKFLNNCNCEDFKILISELDKWYTLYGSETFRNGYPSGKSRAQLGEIMSKYYNLNKDEIYEYLKNWFFAQDFIIQPDGNSYKLEKGTSKLSYKIPYINNVEDFKFNRVGNLENIKNHLFSYDSYNYFVYDSIHEQSIYKHYNSGFLRNKTIAQVKDRVLYKTTYNYQNVKIKEVSSNKTEERFYHKNGKLSFSLPYGQEVESVVGYDSIGNVSYKDGNGTIYNIVDSDDENISYSRTYKNFYKISEIEYFGNTLVKSREFSNNINNIETTRKTYHWKNGLVIKEEPSDMAENINLYHNYPRCEEIILENFYIRLLPDDLVANKWEYPMSSSKFEPAKLLNEEELKELFKHFITDPNYKESISESPILDFTLDFNLESQTIYYDAFFQSKINEIVKISPAKYDGKEVSVPLKMYITLVFK